MVTETTPSNTEGATLRTARMLSGGGRWTSTHMVFANGKLVKMFPAQKLNAARKLVQQLNGVA